VLDVYLRKLKNVVKGTKLRISEEKEYLSVSKKNSSTRDWRKSPRRRGGGKGR